MDYDIPAKTWARRHKLSDVNDLESLKKFFRGRENYEKEWLEVQEWLYTEGILSASVRSGTPELLALLKARKAKVFIVSHKTSFSAGKQIDLVTPAQEWIRTTLKNPGIIPTHQVFFEPTRDKKVTRIKQLELTHFVDDLLEIFVHKEYPKGLSNFLLKSRFRDPAFENFIVVKDFFDILPYV